MIRKLYVLRGSDTSEAVTTEDSDPVEPMLTVSEIRWTRIEIVLEAFGSLLTAAVGYVLAEWLLTGPAHYFCLGVLAAFAFGAVVDAAGRLWFWCWVAPRERCHRELVDVARSTGVLR